MTVLGVETAESLEIIEDVAPYDDTDDGNKHLTHIINPPNNLHIWEPGMSSKDIVDIARTSELPVFALCGYKFVPRRNPDKYPACQTCMDIAGQLMRSNGE